MTLVRAERQVPRRLAVATPSRLGYVAALDGVRGIAIIGVLSLHFFGAPPGGFLGVDVFFALSGFLITTLLLDELAERRTVSLRDFYRRRALRLFPALFGMLAVYATLVLYAFWAGVVDLPELRTALSSVAGGALYVQNFVDAFGHSNIETNPLAHLWSLAQEEQFYLVWPVLLLACLRRGSWKRVFVPLGGVLVLVIAHRVALAYSGTTVRRISLAPDTRADGLIVGCMAALCRYRGVQWPAMIRTPAAGLALAGILVGMTLVPMGARVTYVYLVPLLAVAAATLIVAVVEAPGAPVARALSVRPLVLVGKVSYGLYVWHQLMHWLFPQPAAGLAATVLLAAFSYRFVEQPFLRRKRTRGEHRLAGDARLQPEG